MFLFFYDRWPLFYPFTPVWFMKCGQSGGTKSKIIFRRGEYMSTVAWESEPLGGGAAACMVTSQGVSEGSRGVNHGGNSSAGFLKYHLLSFSLMTQ